MPQTCLYQLCLYPKCTAVLTFRRRKKPVESAQDRSTRQGPHSCSMRNCKIAMVSGSRRWVHPCRTVAELFNLYLVDTGGLGQLHHALHLRVGEADGDVAVPVGIPDVDGRHDAARRCALTHVDATVTQRKRRLLDVDDSDQHDVVQLRVKFRF